MPLLFVPIPVILGVIGLLIYATLYSLAESAVILAACFGIAALWYFGARFVLNHVTRIDRMEVKFLSGALAVLVMMVSVIYFVSDNT